MLVGLGGVLAEVLDDVVVGLAPIDRDEALAMLAELRGAPAPRRRPRRAGRRSRGAVAELVVAVGRLGVDRPDIVEIDLNPVIAGAAGAVAVDALVVLAAT